jgi:hypothetical protein
MGHGGPGLVSLSARMDLKAESRAGAQEEWTRMNHISRTWNPGPGCLQDSDEAQMSGPAEEVIRKTTDRAKYLRGPDHQGPGRAIVAPHR